MFATGVTDGKVRGSNRIPYSVYRLLTPKQQ
ncbi:MAG: hypothetical protein BMS9Abin37_0841 [Acidobacteriota bacterium]|nr:MAG: hypothetical protein BMS9Abin37_0841 [Acidobacteriota bacterium]